MRDEIRHSAQADVFPAPRTKPDTQRLLTMVGVDESTLKPAPPGASSPFPARSSSGGSPGSNTGSGVLSAVRETGREHAGGSQHLVLGPLSSPQAVEGRKPPALGQSPRANWLTALEAT